MRCPAVNIVKPEVSAPVPTGEPSVLPTMPARVNSGEHYPDFAAATYVRFSAAIIDPSLREEVRRSQLVPVETHLFRRVVPENLCTNCIQDFTGDPWSADAAHHLCTIIVDASS
jgi:hypothetical protein